MQRLDKSLKKWGLPKVCSQRVYSFLCVPRGEVFHYDLVQNACRNATLYGDTSIKVEYNDTIYLVHKSSEKWVWVLEYHVKGHKLNLVSDKYIKKKLLWENKVPYVMFRDTFYEYYKDKRYYLKHKLRLPAHLGVLG